MPADRMETDAESFNRIRASFKGDDVAMSLEEFHALKEVEMEELMGQLVAFRDRARMRIIWNRRHSHDNRLTSKEGSVCVDRHEPATADSDTAVSLSTLAKLLKRTPGRFEARRTNSPPRARGKRSHRDYDTENSGDDQFAGTTSTKSIRFKHTDASTPACFWCEASGHHALKCPNFDCKKKNSRGQRCINMQDQRCEGCQSQLNRAYANLKQAKKGRTITKPPAAQSSGKRIDPGKTGGGKSAVADLSGCNPNRSSGKGQKKRPVSEMASQEEGVQVPNIPSIRIKTEVTTDTTTDSDSMKVGATSSALCNGHHHLTRDKAHRLSIGSLSPTDSIEIIASDSGQQKAHEYIRSVAEQSGVAGVIDFLRSSNCIGTSPITRGKSREYQRTELHSNSQIDINFNDRLKLAALAYVASYAHSETYVQNDPRRAELAALDAVRPVVRWLSSRRHHPQFCCIASIALSRLVRHRDNKEVARTSGCIPLLVDIISKNLPYVIKQESDIPFEDGRCVSSNSTSGSGLVGAAIYAVDFPELDVKDLDLVAVAVKTLHLLSIRNEEAAGEIFRSGAVSVMLELLSLPYASPRSIEAATGLLWDVANCNVDTIISLLCSQRAAVPLLVKHLVQSAGYTSEDKSGASDAAVAAANDDDDSRTLMNILGTLSKLAEFCSGSSIDSEIKSSMTEHSLRATSSASATSSSTSHEVHGNDHISTSSTSAAAYNAVSAVDPPHYSTFAKLLSGCDGIRAVVSMLSSRHTSSVRKYAAATLRYLLTPGAALSHAPHHGYSTSSSSSSSSSSRSHQDSQEQRKKLGQEGVNSACNFAHHLADAAVPHPACVDSADLDELVFEVVDFGAVPLLAELAVDGAQRLWRARVHARFTLDALSSRVAGVNESVAYWQRTILENRSQS